MRSLSSIFLILVLLSKTIYGICWQVNFHMNQREITRLECVNKNRPEMHCNGKCYLAKQLQKAEEQLDDKKQASSRSLGQLKWLETASYSAPSFPSVHTTKNVAELEKQQFSVSEERIHSDYCSSIFHPPC